MRLLDLFCGAGGAAMGYHWAGFDEIIGVDIVPQPNYPFTFIQGDALQPPVRLEDFDLIHASPPCQQFTTLKAVTGKQYPDLVQATRMLVAPYSHIIENVVGAPLVNPIMLCGSSFGLRLDDGAELRRHRIFETSFFLMAAPCYHQGIPLGVYGHLTHSRRNNNANRARSSGWKAGKAEARTLMGIDWMMTDQELSQAIPPAYTQWLGEQFLQQVAA